jgi:hypothetical protein
MDDDGERFRLPGDQDVFFDGSGWVLWWPPDEGTKVLHSSLEAALIAAGRPDLAAIVRDDRRGKR